MRRLAASALLMAAAAAGAQERPAGYPAKPIRIVIGIAPGGGLDAMTRLGAQKLVERWGQSVIVDNRPGGGTVLAMDMVAVAPPDGYTLLGASETIPLVQGKLALGDWQSLFFIELDGPRKTRQVLVSVVGEEKS